jgi:putative membrane protein
VSRAFGDGVIRILGRVLANAAALMATTVVPGIEFRGGAGALLACGAIFAVFNAIVRPLAWLVSLPLLVLTLGLFYFILNGLLLLVASWVLPGYRVSGLLAGVLGSLVLAVANWAINVLFAEKKRPD